MVLTALERFEAKYEAEPTTGCWLWTGATFYDRYGAFRLGREQRAHRAGWVLANGPIPEGLSVLHRCDTPLCVNPAHLFLGTTLDNMRDKVRKGRHARTDGENSHVAKLTQAQVDDIRRRAPRTVHEQRRVAEEFGVSRACIYDIMRGRRWAKSFGGDSNSTLA